jgi:dipeptidyl-peptidase-4
MPLLLMSLVCAASLDDLQFLKDYAETRRFMSGRPVGPKVTPDGRAVLFLRAQPRDARQWLYELDLEAGRTRVLLSPESLLAGASETLTAEEKARLERQRVTARGFTAFQLSPDGARVLVALSGRLWLADRASGAARQLETGEGAAIDPKFSPDGARIGYVRGHDVYVLDLASKREQRVTRGGTEVVSHGLAEFVAQEEMSRFSGYWFSPDGQALAFQETDTTAVEALSISDPLKPEVEPQRFRYPRAGRSNATVRLGLTALAGGPVRWVRWDAERFPYLATVRWPKRGALSVLVQNRAQTHAQLLAVDPRNGKTRLLLEERDGAWVSLDQKFPAWLADGSGFFWTTERHGAPEVELRNADGTLRSSWVPPAAGFAEWVGYHDEARTLYFAGGPEPTQRAVYAVSEGGEPRRVKTPSEGPVTESATLAEKANRLVLTSTSTVALPRTWVLSTGGDVLAELESVAEQPGLALNITIAQLSDERTSWSAVLRPRDFAAGRKYPVILSVYGGPHHQVVTRGVREHLLDQWLANQGFIVVKVDGRGTPRRGAVWERAVKGDLATPIVTDQLSGLRELGRTLPELDLTRVGVYGWSFGGYLSALLALSRPEEIRCAVAGAPVVDWRDYDTHYTERYLGLPQETPGAYEVSSLLTYVPSAARPVLLIHGTADDNVYFLHTLKLSDALFRAGKPHEVLPLSNFTHAVPEPVATERLWARVATYFREHL